LSLNNDERSDSELLKELASRVPVVRNFVDEDSEARKRNRYHQRLQEEQKLLDKHGQAWLAAEQAQQRKKDLEWKRITNGNDELIRQKEIEINAERKKQGLKPLFEMHIILTEKNACKFCDQEVQTCLQNYNPWCFDKTAVYENTPITTEVKYALHECPENNTKALHRRITALEQQFRNYQSFVDSHYRRQGYL
jgi:hypothetical protein